MKYTYRLWPFQIQDHKIAALWLNAMEEKGWRLRSIHPIFPILKFEKRKIGQGEECLYHYDTDVFPEKDPKWGTADKEKEEAYNRWIGYASICEDAGWELIGRVNCIHIFQSLKRDKVPPLQTEPDMIRENTVAAIKERYRPYNLPLGIVCLTVSILLSSWLKEDADLLLYNSALLWIMMMFLLSLAVIGQGLIGFSINRISRIMFLRPEIDVEEPNQPGWKLKREEAQTSMIYRAAAKMHVIYFIYLIFVFLTATLIFNIVSEAFKTPLGGFGGSTYVFAALLPGLIANRFSIVRNRRKYIQRNMKKAEQDRWCKKMGCDMKRAGTYIAVMWILAMLLFAFIAYGTYQASIRTEFHWDTWVFNEISVYEDAALEVGGARIDYYDAKSKWAADRIYDRKDYRMKEDYIYLSVIPEGGFYADEEIDNPEFFGSDRGIYRDDEKKSLLLQKGNKVISIRYYPGSSSGESENLETDTLWRELFWDLQ